MSRPVPSSALSCLVRLHLATSSREGLAERLLVRFRSPCAVFAAHPAALSSVPGVTPAAAARIQSRALADAAEREVERVRRKECTILVRDLGQVAAEEREIARALPPLLGGLEGMPPLLFATGEWCDEDAVAIGVVGSRRATPYGLRQADRFAAAFARRGVTVVSGLARGIDGAAQRGALDAGGRTIAVLGSGLGRIYPPEHRGLAETIVSKGRGAVITEHPWDAPPRSFHFPARNRVISALSKLILVVEAGERSGSLITVDQALRHGRPVWVVPGRVDTPEARGVLELLRDGAAPAIDPEDVLADSALGLPIGQRRREASPASKENLFEAFPGELGASLATLFQEEDRWTADRIASRLRRPVPEVLAELARLEIEGWLRRGDDGWERAR